VDFRAVPGPVTSNGNIKPSSVALCALA
jgi:hypothetical protein